MAAIAEPEPGRIEHETGLMIRCRRRDRFGNNLVSPTHALLVVMVERRGGRPLEPRGALRRLEKCRECGNRPVVQVWCGRPNSVERGRLVAEDRLLKRLLLAQPG